MIISTTILGVTTCCSIIALVWTTRRTCPSCEAWRTQAQSSQAVYTELTSTLLGVQVSQTPAISPQPPNTNSSEQESDPESVFDALSPEIQAALLREYEESLTLHPKNIRVHPEVEQIIPGQTMSAAP
jgi:hypothetical protein